MKAVSLMYHYVRNDPQSKAFSTDDFRKQVSYLSRRYRIVSLSECIENVRSDEDQDICLLTFDDGVKDHYTNVFPILEEFGVKGVFFVPTRILVENKVIAAQKRAMLLTKLGEEGFLEEYNCLVPSYLAVREGKAMDQYNTPKVSILKYLLDHMDHDLAEKTLGTMFAKHFDEETEFHKMYLSREDVREMRARGHDMGSHGHAHRWLGNLYSEDQHRDLKASVDVFKDLFSAHPRFMSYPFGSRNEITTRILPELGFEASFLDPTSAVRMPNMFELNRYDCIDVSENEPLPNVLMRRTQKDL